MTLVVSISWRNNYDLSGYSDLRVRPEEKQTPNQREYSYNHDIMKTCFRNTNL